MWAGWGWLGGVALIVAGCGQTGLATQAVVADVGRGPLVVLVGGDNDAARKWLDAATPGYRLVQVTAPGDLDELTGTGPRVLVVPGRYQALGLQLAEQDAKAVAGILLLADGTPLSPAWRQALTTHGWKWRQVDAKAQTIPPRHWWQDWLPARQAAFSVQPSPMPPVRPVNPGNGQAADRSIGGLPGWSPEGADGT